MLSFSDIRENDLNINNFTSKFGRSYISAKARQVLSCAISWGSGVIINTPYQILSFFVLRACPNYHPLCPPPLAPPMWAPYKNLRLTASYEADKYWVEMSFPRQIWGHRMIFNWVCKSLLTRFCRHIIIHLSGKSN